MSTDTTHTETAIGTGRALSAERPRGGADTEMLAELARHERAGVHVDSGLRRFTADTVTLKPRLVGDIGRTVADMLDLDTVARPFLAVASALRDQEARTRQVGENTLLAEALDRSRRGEHIDPALLTDLMEARRERERGEALAAATATLQASHAEANTARFADCRDDLEDALAAYLRDVLERADAAFGELHRAGVVTAEDAMEKGLDKAWLARAGLPERWLEAQHARVWTAHVADVGFGTPSLGSFSEPMQPRRRLAGDASANFSEFWEAQFVGRHRFTEYTTPSEVLQWWVQQPTGKRPAPLTD